MNTESKNLVKARLNCKTRSTADRRKSRGMEQKKNREKAVNQSRKLKVLSDELNMSPVAETVDITQCRRGEQKRSNDSMPETRLERLKKWRAQKQKQKEGDKNTKSNVFKAGRLDHNDANLYTFERTNKIMPKELEPVKAPLPKANAVPKKLPVGNGALPKVAQPKVSSEKKKIKPKEWEPTNASLPKALLKKLPVCNGALPKVTQPKVSAEKKVTRTGGKSVPVEIKRIVEKVSAPRTQRTVSKPAPELSDLSSKLTAAARAKMNVNKQQGFLRSKSKGTLLQKKNDKCKSETTEKGKKALLETVKATDQEEQRDSSDPHLSDSTVPSPKHSTPAVHTNSRKSLSRPTRLGQVSDNSSDEQIVKTDLAEAVKKTPRRKSRRASVRNIEFDAEDSPVKASLIGSSRRKSIRTKNSKVPECVDSESHHIEEQDLPTLNDNEEALGCPLDDQLDTNLQNVEDILHVSEYPDGINHLNSSLSILEKSNKENMFESKKAVRSAKSIVRHRRSRHSLTKRRSRHSLAKDLSFSAGKSQRRKSSRVQSQRKSIPNSEFDIDHNTEMAAELADKNVFEHSSMDVDEDVPVRDENEADTQALDVIDTKTSLPEETLGAESVSRKRKSSRTAELTSTSSSEVENEAEQFTSLKKKPGRRSSVGRGRKTPRRSSRRHRRSSSITPRRGSHSTIVSISDEGTTNMKGSNVVENVVIPDQVSTPAGKTEAKLEQLGSKDVQRNSSQSLTVSVSGDGISTGDDETSTSSTAAYHIGKCSLSEKQEARILQELVVERVDGEISFIEVPMDDSFAGSPVKRPSVNSSLSTKADSTRSFSPRRSESITADSSGQEENIREAVVTPEQEAEQNIGSMQSPLRKVGDEEEEVRSSENVGAHTPEVKKETEDTNMTPRSLRSRGRSLAPSAFKEPGEPLSALRARSARRRRKTGHCTPSKTPEQMIALLKKSPMIEMSRRRSRHVSSPAGTQSNFLAIMDELSVKEAANKSSPAILEKTNNSPVVENDSPTQMTVENYSGIQPVVENAVACVEYVTVAAESVESGSVTPEEMQVDESVEQSQEDIQAANVKPFRDILVQETTRLNILCDEWYVTSTTAGLSDDVLGEIRSVVGKAQLLIKDRFKQFSGLVDNCQFSRGEKETTPTDLQGFWEMIYFQVEDVHKMFAELTKLQQNGWQFEVTEPIKKTVAKPKPVNKNSKPKAKSNFAAFRAEVMKRKALAAGATKKVEVENNTESPKATKTFDGGFFAVQSPCKESEEKDDVGQREKSGENISTTPANPINKENESSIRSQQKRVSMSVKKLRYTPAKNSPLLTDITHFEGKMS